MTRKTRIGIAALCLAITVTAAVAAGFGAFARGDGSTAHAVSIRGEEFEYVTGGVYAYNAERVVAEGVGWDYLTLFAVVPAMLLALPSVARGSLRGRLFAAGILGYFFYQYLMYAVFWAFGPLFPVFIVIYASSAAGIVWIVSTVDVASLPQRFTARFPRRSMAVFSALMALQLVAMWVPRIVAAMNGDLKGANFLGMPTLSVQALDLGVIVPVALATAAFTFRRRPWGYLLSAVFAVKGVAMAGAIVAMLVSAWVVEGAPETGSLVTFSIVTGIVGLLACRIYASMTREDEGAPPAVLEEAA